MELLDRLGQREQLVGLDLREMLEHVVIKEQPDLLEIRVTGVILDTVEPLVILEIRDRLDSQVLRVKLVTLDCRESKVNLVQLAWLDLKVRKEL